MSACPDRSAGTFGGKRYCGIMSVKEIVEALDKLSSEERATVKTWLEENTPAPTAAEDAAFEAAADRVFEHYAPALKKLAE